MVWKAGRAGGAGGGRNHRRLKKSRDGKGLGRFSKGHDFNEPHRLNFVKH